MFEISFSKSIKNFRKENNLSQAEFANMLQVSRTTVVSYEKGTKEPTLYVLFRAAKIMNCSLDELVGINSPENFLSDKHISAKDGVDTHTLMSDCLKCSNIAL